MPPLSTRMFRRLISCRTFHERKSGDNADFRRILLPFVSAKYKKHVIITNITKHYEQLENTAIELDVFSSSISSCLCQVPRKIVSNIIVRSFCISEINIINLQCQTPSCQFSTFSYIVNQERQRIVITENNNT